jgi:2-keto-4-pentenoate hydratase/2-oxohepta-3-ene-1,7-dioic acid hydratase in catechol pathway
MTRWMRFEHDGREGFGALEDDTVRVHQGDLFAGPSATGETLPLDAVKILTPTVPSKMVALWNNFHALAKKLEINPPEEPLYFLKANSSFLAHGETIRRPASYQGRVVYEGELGIVIGKLCRNVDEHEAAAGIFGYTCINDVTAVDLLNKDPSFAQWTRAKSFDGFGVFGPVVATGLDPAALSVRTVLNDAERQNYPVSDMVFPPARLVSLISRDVTLLPGDVIACGTSVGVGSMKEPSNQVEISIEGIGTLANNFDQ